jgi:hypothetical protein
MPPFFVVLIKINLVLAFFAIAYFLILRRLTFYVLNRIFLVFGMLFSSLYPFIDLTDFFHNQQQLNSQIAIVVPAINQQVKDLAPVGFIAKYRQLISALFYAGVAAMAARLIFQFVSLYRLHKRSSPGLVDSIPVRILKEPVSPFSFWQNIYINPSLHKERDLTSILVHEQIHVKQWHTLDIMLAELSVVFYWFNPGVWLMKKAVKENLEFITDEKVLKRGVDKKAYQYSLVDVGNLTAAAGFTNSFNISDLKKRIQMMNVKRSSRLTLSRYVLILPVLLLTALLLTVSKRKVIKYFTPATPQVVYSNIKSASDGEQTTATKRSVNKRTTPRKNAVIKLAKSTGAVDQMHKDLPGSIRLATSMQVAEMPAAITKPRTDTIKVVYSLQLKAAIDSLVRSGQVPPQPETTKDKAILVVQGFPASGKQIRSHAKTPGNKDVLVVQGYPAPRSNKNQP